MAHIFESEPPVLPQPMWARVLPKVFALSLVVGAAAIVFMWHRGEGSVVDAQQVAASGPTDQAAEPADARKSETVARAEVVAGAEASEPAEGPERSEAPAGATPDATDDEAISADEATPDEVTTADEAISDDSVTSPNANAPGEDDRRDRSKARAEDQAGRSRDRRTARRRASRTRAAELQAGPESTDAPRVERRMREATQALVQGRVRDAIHGFEAVTKQAPRKAEAWRSLGFARERLKRHRAAARAYRRYLDLAPRARDADTVRRRLASL